MSDSQHIETFAALHKCRQRNRELEKAVMRAVAREHHWHRLYDELRAEVIAAINPDPVTGGGQAGAFREDE
jgi:hypothetical protein